MIIQQPQLRRDRGRCIAHTLIHWEDNDIPSEDIYFNVPSDYIPNQDIINGAFLMATALPALHKKESRVRLDGPVDPAIINCIDNVLAQQIFWFGYPKKKIIIEAVSTVPLQRNVPNRAATFFSGGVDSLWTLRRNMLTLPKLHPLRIQDAIIAYGFDMGITGDEDLKLFDLTLQHLQNVVHPDEVNLLPVYTNIRSLFDDSNFWAARWHGTVLASVGYMLSGKITDVFIPSTNDLWHAAPWGSSPLIDPIFVTTNLRLYHDGLDQTRLDKVRMLSNWPVALKHIRVCTKVDLIPDGHLNCGICEKCLRTKLELLVCNALEKSPVFASKGIADDMISNLNAFTEYQASEYEELIVPLREIGQNGHANAVNSLVRRWEKYSVWRNEEDWKGLIKKFLRRYLGWKTRDVKNLFPVR